MKTRFILFTAAATFALAMLSPEAGAAGKGKGNKHPKAKPTPVPEKVNASGPKIASVSGDTVAIEFPKGNETYKISGETIITLNGNRARSTDLKPGMPAEIGVSSIRPGLLLSISATSK
jgi:hypothetical protein